MQIIMAGGTNAGWRRIKARVTHDWRCKNCKAWVKKYWLKCPNCNEPRPE